MSGEQSAAVDKVNEKVIEDITSEELINSKNSNVDTYASPQLTTTDYGSQQLPVEELGPGPPAVMPLNDYSEEQKQIAETTEQSPEIQCTNIVTTIAIENGEKNYATNVEFAHADASEITTIDTTTTTTTTTTSTVSPCTMQTSSENKQTFPTSAPSTFSTQNIVIDATSTEQEQARNITIEIIPESYDETTTITATASYLELSENQISSTKPLLPVMNRTISLPQTTTITTTTTTAAPNIGTGVEKEDRMKELKTNNTVISQPSQISTYTNPSLFNIPNVTETTSTPLRTSTTSTGIVLNRLRGKARLICKEDGLQFEINTLFPFTGQIFARDRKPATECYFTFHEATLIKITMPYAACGMRNSEEQRPETQYHIQIIVIFHQKDNTSTMQSFLTQCVHQKIQYQKQVIPKRIEEALEELRLVPMKLEHKAQVPECMMRIVTEEEHGHDDDGTEIEIVNLGQPMRIEWSLLPESGYKILFLCSANTTE
uniref:ZP domain-containing protein n=1 Tax=Elaeophora elaphi TaxID=1147741 RepID=A0A0R3RL74_9BILA